MATYIKNPDGTYTVIIEKRSDAVSPEKLRSMQQDLQKSVDHRAAVEPLTPEQCAFTHRVWERYREPIGKGLMTWAQAIQNALAADTKEIVVIEDALKAVVVPK